MQPMGYGHLQSVTVLRRNPGIPGRSLDGQSLECLAFVEHPTEDRTSSEQKGSTPGYHGTKISLLSILTKENFLYEANIKHFRCCAPMSAAWDTSLSFTAVESEVLSARSTWP